jgi:gluconate kinase
MALEIILITGPSGSGKTTVAFEVSAILKASEVGHGLIDTDELDRLYPAPPSQENLTSQNLQAIWKSFSNYNCEKLIMCGVMTNVSHDLDWIKKIMPKGSGIYTFRLTASTPVIHDRLKRREIGSLLNEHLASSDKAARRIASSDDKEVTHIDTENKPISDISHEILRHTEWLETITNNQ